MRRITGFDERLCIRDQFTIKFTFSRRDSEPISFLIDVAAAGQEQQQHLQPVLIGDISMGINDFT